jgi:hypothetical protein
MATNGFDPATQYARISERVENQGKDIIDLRSNMNTGFQTVNAAIAGLSNELRNNSRTQWPVIWAALSVGVTILAGLGFMSLQPIKDNTARLETAFVRLSESSVSQKEMEWRTARGAEDRLRTEASISDIRSNTVGRNEWSERNHARDNEIASLSQRIEELRQQAGAIYGTRDVVVDIKRQVDNLRQIVFERVGPGAAASIER